jgi:hypothetical protein
MTTTLMLYRADGAPLFDPLPEGGFPRRRGPSLIALLVAIGLHL